MPFAGIQREDDIGRLNTSVVQKSF